MRRLPGGVDVPGPQEPGEPAQGGRPRLDQWRYAFTNTFPRRRSSRPYERYHIPANGGILWGSVLANFQPGHQDTWVDDQNDKRAPLLLVLRLGGPHHAAGRAALERQALQVQHGDRGQEYDGYAHLLPAQRAGRRSRTRCSSGQWLHATVIVTHVGGPTTLLEVGGWRLLTDPTFDPPGGHYAFGWGTASDKVVGPAIAADDLRPLDAVLLTHDQHGDNLDAAGRALLPSVPQILTTRSGAERLGVRGAPGSARATGSCSRSMVGILWK